MQLTLRQQGGSATLTRHTRRWHTRIHRRCRAQRFREEPLYMAVSNAPTVQRDECPHNFPDMIANGINTAEVTKRDDVQGGTECRETCPEIFTIRFFGASPVSPVHSHPASLTVFDFAYLPRSSRVQKNRIKPTKNKDEMTAVTNLHHS